MTDGLGGNVDHFGENAEKSWLQGLARLRISLDGISRNRRTVVDLPAY